MHVPRHLQNNVDGLVRRFNCLVESLSQANRPIPTVIEIFLVSYATSVLVHVPSVKHQLRELDFLCGESPENVYIEYLPQVGSHRVQVVKPPIREAIFSAGSHLNVTKQLLYVGTDY